jgi:glycosyltransferase involved in cell wall biosynthesis
MEKMINLSVIIPTRNRAETLFTTLLSIKEQTLDQSLFEVVVCDNNSTDNTAEIAKSFENKFLNFSYYKTLQPGLHVGRNKGFLEAKGRILVYADDDIEAFPEWLYTINEVFEDKNTVLVGGKNLPKWEVDPPKWVLEMWKPNNRGESVLGCLSIIDLGDEIKEISPYYVFGCNFSIRKNIITETKGFHPDGMPNEIIEYRGDGESAVSAYIKQKGYKAMYHPNASVYHCVSKERLTIDYFKKRGFSWGVSDSYTSIRIEKLIVPKKMVYAKSIFASTLHHLLMFYNILKGTNKEINIYRKAFTDGHKEGYNFHQEKTRKFPQLLAWVLKDNYLDGDFPVL